MAALKYGPSFSSGTRRAAPGFSMSDRKYRQRGYQDEPKRESQPKPKAEPTPREFRTPEHAGVHAGGAVHALRQHGVH